MQVIDEADRLCPATAPTTWEALVGTLAELGRASRVSKVARLIQESDQATAAARAAAPRAVAAIEARAGGAVAASDRERSRADLRAGFGAWERRRWADAEQAFLRAWEAARPNPEALYFAGLAAQASGQPAEARRLFDRDLEELDAAAGEPARVALDDALRDGIDTIAWSRDGRYLATAKGPAVSLRDALQGFGEAMRIDGAEQAPITAVDFSPDGKLLAVASHHHTRIWDLATGLPAQDLSGAVNVDAVRFSPDGATLASTGGSSLALWRVATGARIQLISPLPDRGDAFDFSPDGKTLAFGAEGTVRVWDVAAGVEVRRLPAPAEQVRPVRFSPDGKVLLAGSMDGKVRSWDVGTWKERRVMETAADGLDGLAISPDGAIIAVWTQERLPGDRHHDPIRFRDFASGRLLREIDHKGPVLRGAIAFSPDGRWFAATEDGDLDVWSVAPWSQTYHVGLDLSRAKAVVFSPDGKTLATGIRDGTVRLWSTARGGALRVLRGHEKPVVSLAFCGSGETLASASPDGTLRLWDPERGLALKTIADGRRVAALACSPAAEPSVADAGDLGGVAISPDGRLRASIADDGSIRLEDRAGTDALVLRAIAGADAGLVMTPGSAPLVELVGPEANRAAGNLVCRVGPHSFSFDLCRERVSTDGLLEAFLSGLKP